MELLVCDVADLFPRQLFLARPHAKLAVGVFDLLLLYPDIVSCDSYFILSLISRAALEVAVPNTIVILLATGLRVGSASSESPCTTHVSYLGRQAPRQR